MNVESVFFEPLAKANPLTALKQSILSNEQAITELNKEQLDKGLDSEGHSLGRYKNFKYKGRYEPVDLKLKNDFRGKMRVEANDEFTRIYSPDVKEAKLKKQYGEAIEGVPESMIPKMETIIYPDFVSNYQKQFS